MRSYGLKGELPRDMSGFWQKRRRTTQVLETAWRMPGWDLPEELYTELRCNVIPSRNHVAAATLII